MVYGSHDSYGKWVNGRPKYWACLPDPRASQNMTIKYLSVGQMSRFIYQQIALDVLFQMRYNSLPNSDKQPSNRLRAETTPCFHLSQLLLFCSLFLLTCSGVFQHSFTFWSVIQSLLGEYPATISHMKEDSNTFHMTSNTIIFIWRISLFWLESYSKWGMPRISRVRVLLAPGRVTTTRMCTIV